MSMIEKYCVEILNSKGFHDASVDFDINVSSSRVVLKVNLCNTEVAQLVERLMQPDPGATAGQRELARRRSLDAVRLSSMHGEIGVHHAFGTQDTENLFDFNNIEASVEEGELPEREGGYKYWEELSDEICTLIADEAQDISNQLAHDCEALSEMGTPECGEEVLVEKSTKLHVIRVEMLQEDQYDLFECGNDEYAMEDCKAVIEGKLKICCLKTSIIELDEYGDEDEAVIENYLGSVFYTPGERYIAGTVREMVSEAIAELRQNQNVNVSIESLQNQAA